MEANITQRHRLGISRTFPFHRTMSEDGGTRSERKGTDAPVAVERTLAGTLGDSGRHGRADNVSASQLCCCLLAASFVNEKKWQKIL